MNSIRFKSVLNPDKWGFEYTNDNMSMWEQVYRTAGAMGNCFGYFETYGDNTTQHTPTMPCRLEHFTDFCLSLVKHMLANPQDELTTYTFGLEPTNAETIRFLAGIRFREDKRQWFTLDGNKISTSDTKRYDKRWFGVPTDANGTIGSALTLFHLAMGDRNRHWFELYAEQDLFHSTLYGTHGHGEEWDKRTSYRKDIPGDHHSAFQAVDFLVRGSALVQFAGRAAECAEGNSRRQAEAAQIAA
jgi:hypothetical protein